MGTVYSWCTAVAHTAFRVRAPLRRASQRKCSLGKPDQRELSENLAATQGLAHMIMECNRLFQVCHVLQRSRSMAQGEGCSHSTPVAVVCSEQQLGPEPRRGPCRPGCS